MGFIQYVKEEMQVIKERDAAIKSSWEVFLYPSFRAILRHRLAHKLYLKKHYFLARWYSQRTARKTGIEIHPGATIGKGLFIDHGHGVDVFLHGGMIGKKAKSKTEGQHAAVGGADSWVGGDHFIWQQGHPFAAVFKHCGTLSRSV